MGRANSPSAHADNRIWENKLTTAVSVPTIYQLTIERFRGIKSLKWAPATGVNVLLGGGDVGKTTVLDAIGLLFSPTNGIAVSDTDYNGRKDEDGFLIEAVVSLPSAAGINQLTKPAWPWVWNGSEALIPDHKEDGTPSGEEVYRLRVSGTAELELSYEIVQPNGTTDSFPVSLRRLIGLVRLSGDDRNDRDLRLVQGSALDRLLSDKGMRSRMASELAKSDIRSKLADEARTALEGLDDVFKARQLPNGLDIAITGGQGASIASMVGLTAKKDEVQLPLSNWGAGTRRLSALAIAEQLQNGAPITLVDEVERGLEPYRQRVLMEKLQDGKSQTFITTHSPAAISAASKASLWHMDYSSTIGQLDGKKVALLREYDPEAFLARLTIVAEGATEVGFTSALLERAIGASLKSTGIHVADGGGHDTTIEVLEALSGAGLRFGGFADDEGRHPTRWAALQTKLGGLLFRWKAGDLEANVFAVVPEGSLEALLEDPTGAKTGLRLRTLADRLNLAVKDVASIKSAAGTGLRQLMLDAARGSVPAGTEEKLKKEFKNHAQAWFKSVAGGRELEGKVFQLNVWAGLRDELLPFCKAICTATGRNVSTDLSS
jgi:putative ATP-dependent endonuclease of OLD family